ncbi:protocadherin-9-like [Littorina saxatilis]|uniref:protocadherin-9-like n=1 Tax=Littorina saxatilis TaxID=31220 RepID=UPI0038B6A67F
MENADVGDLFQLPSAIDADTGANHSVQEYSLLTNDVPFSLQTQTASAPEVGLWLRLNGGLDRETVDSYRLLLVAKDGGMPVRSGTLTINVKVGDVNDHTPSWDQDQYTVNVSEITTVDTTVLTLQAYDADSGANGRLAYRFTPLQPDTALGLFDLNQTSGQLTVVKPLDNYAGQTYSLEVEARDSGTPYKASRTDVIIRVLDTHNSKPEIILSVFGQGNVAVLSEFSELGRVVAHLSIVDPDKGLNGIVVCETAASHFQLQAMDVRQYKVILSSPLDRESRDRHDVDVTCHDAGSPPLSASKSFTVKVQDENDETPVFSKTRYEARINESSAGNGAHDVFITTVTATDNDVGENARLSFRILDDPRNEFRVLNNGTVLATRGLDRESGESPRYLRIIASDNGAIEYSATATLVLTILDVNDNRPAFTDPTPLFYVSEGAPVTSSVGNVTATDKDADENAIVLFRMHPVYEGRVPFKVITDGVIKTNGTLDRESKDRYEFMVIAHDLGKPQLSSTVTVTVRVMDVNDNSPAFVFPNDVNNTVSVPHTLSPNTAVTSIRAYDVDLGRNGELVFSRDGRNGTKFFDVKPSTGEVLLVRSLSETELGDHIMTVVVHDLGFPTQLANQTLLYIHVYRGNQSALATSDGEAFRNTLLVVVIVAVTVVLSVAVVVTMLMMRRNDRQRRLYRAKEEECKVDHNLRHLTNKPLSQECDVSTAGSDSSATSSDPRRRKEVSFSLRDEDNNIAPGSAAMTFETVAADSMEAIPEVTQSQKCLLEPRTQEDNMSDASCDVSTSDSGRGGSDVEMHSHHGASKESGDTSFASHRGLPSHSLDSRRQHHPHQHPHPHPNQHPIPHPNQHPNPHPLHQQQRSVTFDLYPTTFSPRGSGRLSTFPTSHISDDVTEDNPRHNMTSFSSFSPLARQGQRGSPTSTSSSASSSLPPSRRHQASRQSRASREMERDNLPHPYPASSAHYGEGEDGSYVDLKRQQRHPAVECHGDYMDMTGSPTYVPTSQLSVATSGTWDGETTTSGSYTVDAQELSQEIDKLFFDTPKDVVV